MAEKNHKNDMVKQRCFRIQIGAFAGLLAAGCIAGFLFPLRPSESALEKRTLTELPEFTIPALMDGSYLSGLTTWYADTYPGREQMLTAYASFTDLFGIRSSSVHGGLSSGDDIPELPLAPSEPEQTATPAPTPTDTPGNTSPVPVISETEEMTPAATGTPQATPAPQTTVTPAPTPSGSFEQVYGSVYVNGDTGYGLYYFNLNAADTYINLVNHTADSLNGISTVYDILVPTSSYLYLPESIQESFGCSNEADAFRYIGGSMNSRVTVVPIIDTLVSHKQEYIYFRTDHHWTALAAYYAYEQFASYKGITANPLASYQTMTFDGFLGSFYTGTQASSLMANPDTVIAYVPNGTNNMTAWLADGSVLNWYVINDVTNYNAYNKYSCFIAGDNPYSEIHNSSITDGSSCLVIKESFGNAFVPFLVDHYENIYVIDYRYYSGGILAFARENGIDDVIFVNNADALSSSESMERLYSIVY